LSLREDIPLLNTLLSSLFKPLHIQVLCVVHIEVLKQAIVARVEIR